MELHELADGLLLLEPGAVERCVEFILSETLGHWHGRARAMMCRRLKHCDLEPTHKARLLACITGRLAAGSFSEQFKDQLRLAMHLDLPRTFQACRECAASPKPHVRRYAAWVLSHDPR
jgi:hypothetical protein